MALPLKAIMILCLLALGVVIIAPEARAQGCIGIQGCVTAAQNGHGGGAPTGGDTSAVAAWDHMTAGDPQGVDSGMLPPDVLKYDAQIKTLLSQAQSILATKDKARARVWSREMNNLMSARSHSLINYSTTQAEAAKARANAMGAFANTLANGSQRRSMPQPSQGLHICPDGVGMVGTGPSGEPLCN